MNTFWPLCLEHFSSTLSSQQFKTWVQPLNGEIKDGQIDISAPNRFLLKWARDNYSSVFKDIASKLGHDGVSISFSISNRDQAPNLDEQSLGVADLPINSEKESAGNTSKISATRLNSSFNFDNFVTGKVNHQAEQQRCKCANTLLTPITHFLFTVVLD